MASPLNCPHCGLPLPTEFIAEQDPIVFASLPSQTIETLLPATFCGDESPGGQPGSPVVSDVTLPDQPILRDSAEFSLNGSGEFDPLASPVADPLLDVFATADPDAKVAAPASSQAKISLSIDEEAPPPSWPFVFLASYASAMTIAVAWLLWQGRGQVAIPNDTLPKPSRTDQAKESNRIEPIPAAYRIDLEKTLTVGSLEFTPLTFRLGSVWQEFIGADGERMRADSPQCWILKVAIKNVSKKDSFAPLDLAFLRESDSGKAESFLEIARSRLESYPLAMSSERSIVGQTFPILKPGESVETLLATEPSAREAMSSGGVWRIPLRIAPDRIVTIGVNLARQDKH